MYYVGLFVLSAVVFRFLCFFRVFKMFLAGLANAVRLCLTSDIVLLIDWLCSIDLFSCIAASVFNKLAYLLTYLLDTTATHCLLLQWNPDWFYLSGTDSPG